MTFLDQFAQWSELGRTLNKYSPAELPLVVALALALVLAAFGLASRRWLNFLGATLLAAVGLCCALAPDSANTAVSLGAGLGSLLVSIAGYRSRRLEIKQREEIDKLRENVAQLQRATERQFLRSLNARPQETLQTLPPDEPTVESFHHGEARDRG